MSSAPTPLPPTVPAPLEGSEKLRPKVPVASVALVQATAEEVALQRELDALAAPALPAGPPPLLDGHEDLPAVKTVTSSLDAPMPSANDDVDPGSDLPPPPGIVCIDGRKPLPHNLPPLAQVLDGIAGDVNIHSHLMPVHQKVVALFPNNVLDAVRTHVTGHEDPLALAAANAWRALVADDLLERAYGVDQPALQLLVDEAVDAREKVLAAALFSFEGSEATEPLAAALAAAIERLTERVRFKGTPKRERTAAPSVKPVSGLTLRERFIRFAFIVTFLFTAAFHLADSLAGGPGEKAWVVVGDPARGHAVLAPARIDADASSLEAARKELLEQGFTTTLSPTGEWVITKAP